METIKGYRYTVDSRSDLVDFAKGILALVNMKSSRRGTLLDVRTVEGTNIVIVEAYADNGYKMEELLKSTLDAEEVEVEELKIIELERYDLGDKYKKIEQLEDREEEFMVTFESDL